MNAKWSVEKLTRAGQALAVHLFLVSSITQLTADRLSTTVLTSPSLH